MAYYPFAPETDAIYRLVRGSNVAVFNDPNDPDFVGMLTDVTGLDSAEVREAADDMAQADGGQHGDFYFGRRPVILSGRSYGHATVAMRNARLDKISRASNAMRGDATLSWKPRERRDNLIPYGTFEVDLTGWTVNNPSGVATFTGARSTAYAHSGTASLLYSATNAADATLRTGSVDGRTANSNANRFPVQPGQSYTASFYLNITDPATSTSGGGARLRIYWYKADGTASSVLTNSNSSFYSVTAAALVRPTVTATAPSDAAFGALYIEPIVNWNAASDTYTAYVDSVMVERGTTAGSYFDGSTTGFHWQGSPHKSASGDYIEMFTTLRRQQPVRFSGAWVKDFQIPMVSEYSALFSVGTTVTAALAPATNHTIENRGSGLAHPIIRITGAGTTPYVENTTLGQKVQFVNGFALTSGQWVDVDTLNHTAVRNDGTDVSGSIDFSASTQTWPQIDAGNNTFRLTNGGSFTLTYRDTWA